jgi:hypothetical protein
MRRNELREMLQASGSRWGVMPHDFSMPSSVIPDRQGVLHWSPDSSDSPRIECLWVANKVGFQRTQIEHPEWPIQAIRRLWAEVTGNSID